MPLLFKHGALTTSEQSHIRHGVDKYPFPILLNSQLDYKWAEANLKEHEYAAESGAGGYYVKRSRLYMCLETSHGVFYFLNDKHDYDAVCGLLDKVVDANPFTTIIM